MSLLTCLKVFKEIKDNRKINVISLASKTNLSVKEIKRAVKYLQASDMISEVNSKVKINVRRLSEVS